MSLVVVSSSLEGPYADTLCTMTSPAQEKNWFPGPFAFTFSTAGLTVNVSLVSSHHIDLFPGCEVKPVRPLVNDKVCEFIFLLVEGFNLCRITGRVWGEVAMVVPVLPHNAATVAATVAATAAGGLWSLPDGSLVL